MDLKTLKENRLQFDNECSMDIFKAKTPHEFLSECMVVDFNRTLSTIDIVLDMMGLDDTITDKLVEEMDNLTDTLNQCYQAEVVNSMLDRGFIYLNNVFSNGDLELTFGEVMYHDLDEAIAMAQQLKEIRDLKEKE